MQSQEAKKIKKSLDQLIDLTYQDSDKYKHYHLVINPKELKSKHGHYQWDICEIQIFNFSRKPVFTAMTCIHELAHHVQLIDTGNTDHSEAFFSRCHQLMLTAMALGWFTGDDIAAENDATDSQKLAKYYGEPTTWKIPELEIERSYAVTVKNGYKLKDYLKLNQFKWFSLMQTWQKSVDSLNEAQLLKDLLQQQDNQVVVTISNQLPSQFSIMYYLIVKNGYEQRQALRKLGYTWQGFEIKKCWVKRIVSQTYHEELAKAAEYGLAPQLMVLKSKS